jgi:hypothetical protein
MKMKKQRDNSSAEGLSMGPPGPMGSSGSLNNNNNGYGTTATSAYGNIGEPPMTKSGFCVKVVRLLVFGLCIYLVDVALHLTIASHYLTMRHCHRSISHDLVIFVLGSTINDVTFLVGRVT